MVIDDVYIGPQMIKRVLTIVFVGSRGAKHLPHLAYGRNWQMGGQASRWESMMIMILEIKEINLEN